MTSRDGTRIAVETVGSGPSVVIAAGAFCDRTTSRDLARLLADEFTVHTYDRRGRGDSDRPTTPPFDPLREIADLGAVLSAAGSSHLYGHSSGAVLAALAVAAGRPVRSLALYEPPWSVTARHDGDAGFARIRELVVADLPGDAAATFLRGTGAPDEVVDTMRAGPGWSHMEALAPTLPYDLALVGEHGTPTELLRRLSVPTLVLAGERSAPWARATVDLVTQVIPGARAQTFGGQNHQVEPAVLAPVLREFFTTRT
ncbi:alpha/beta hydrolase [Actinomycetospora sp.]|uniref:alpha/beta fold hydrolase n=1 Tax=Actinomycetospora sp. TaxID=1872135 RepID=UPI002F426E87